MTSTETENRIAWQDQNVRSHELAVDLPDFTDGELTIERFKTDAVDSFYSMKSMFKTGRGASISEGEEYTRFLRNGTLWMSDTPDERNDHIPAARQIRALSLARTNPDASNVSAIWPYAKAEGRVLIGGLGLGMILRFALRQPGITHVDVIEINPETAKVVGDLYQTVAAEHGVTLTIHNEDLWKVKWPSGSYWDVAWFDIWPTLCCDDLDEHTKVSRSYARRTAWYGCWGHDFLLAQRARDKRSNQWW